MASWICPFCGHAQTVLSPKTAAPAGSINIAENSLDKSLGYRISAIGCSNPECQKVEIIFELGTHQWINHRGQTRSAVHNIFLRHKVLPESAAKPQPDYIPNPIVDDYTEACRIKELSPKASATLSRRCLQGMIRDFCKISRKSLYEEINALRDALHEGSAPQGVSADSIDALDAIRKVGNIGAHMERDINVIVDVDPEEAQALIDLVESLFEEWYISRYNRQKRFARLTQIAEKKAKAKNSRSESDRKELSE